MPGTLQIPGHLSAGDVGQQRVAAAWLCRLDDDPHQPGRVVLCRPLRHGWISGPSSTTWPDGAAAATGGPPFSARMGTAMTDAISVVGLRGKRILLPPVRCRPARGSPRGARPFSFECRSMPAVRPPPVGGTRAPHAADAGELRLQRLSGTRGERACPCRCSHCLTHRLRNTRARSLTRHIDLPRAAFD